MAVQMVQKKDSMTWGRFKMKAAPYVFVTPFFVFWLLLMGIPVIFSLFLSFVSWNGVAGNIMKFKGLKNFAFTLSDPNFWEAVGRTLTMGAIGMVFQQILALFFAFVLNSAFLRFREVFKTIFFLPFVTSTVAVGLVFGLLYNNNGLFNYILGTDFFKSLFNIQLPVLWLSSWNFILISQPILALWRWVGWVAILYLAGLQAIPKNLYEAAQVDGATWPQVFFNITLPLLMPMVQFSMTNSIIGSLQSFEESAILLGRTGSGFGGADQAGVTMAIYLYNQAFSNGYYGLAAATSYVLAAMIVILTLFIPVVFKERD
jgi:multiple sugar transport system permease protein